MILSGDVPLISYDTLISIINLHKNNNSKASIISADDKDDCNMILEKIVRYLPIHSPYYLNDDLTNKSERFIVSEIIRIRRYRTSGGNLYPLLSVARATTSQELHSSYM